MSTGQDQHIRWIDVVRFAAILGVIGCHASEAAYNLQDPAYMDSSIVLFIFHVLGRVGVPMFMFISGYLLLDREYDDSRVRRFWTQKWLKLLACAGIWLVIYVIYIQITGRGTTDPVTIIQQLSYTAKIDLPQTWYLGMILGVYALIPFVAVALKKFDKKVFLFPFVLFFIYSVGFSTINNLMFAYMPDHMMELRFDLAFSGGVWGIYLVTGYFLKQGVMKKASNLLLLLGLTASLAAAFLYVLLPCSDKGVFFNSVIWYDNIFVFTSSVMLFELLSRLKNIGGMWYKPVRFIAKYAFPLYLTHNIAILSLAPFVDKINTLFSVKILILFAAGVGIGLVVSWLLAKIPKIGTYITYVKD